MAVSHGSASNPNVEEGTVSAIRSEIDATTERADRLAREGAPEGADVASTIRRVAEDRRCDLIVMGTRGRSRAASVLLGSETEQTIIESRLPVLAVKHYGARLRLLQALFRERFRKGGDLRFG